MPIPLQVVDAFAEEPFRGNPAAVCLLDAAREAPWMQSVAAEMNLSETAFVSPRAEGSFDLRWFTPTVEIDLCGHATLASAHVLWERGAQAQRLTFHTRSGALSAERADSGWIDLDFPATPPTVAPAPAGLIEALGLSPSEVRTVARSRFDWLVEVDGAERVRAAEPDLSKLSGVEARGVMITAGGEPGGRFDFVSRFFAPRSGVNEDPVTGSAHCCLAPFWSARLDKKTLLAYQASKRGGIVRLVLTGDRVQLSGRAVTVLRGELHA
jgi:PhzF family phenazine biosynthesis protein